MTRNELEYITKWLEVNANASKFHNVYDMLEQFKLDFSPMIEEGQTFNSEECQEDDQSLDFVPEQHRVKKEPSRPFRNAKECLSEMAKHQPFGWVYDKNNDQFLNTNRVGDDGVDFYGRTRNTFTKANFYVTFTDGTPFGIKED